MGGVVETAVAATVDKCPVSILDPLKLPGDMAIGRQFGLIVGMAETGKAAPESSVLIAQNTIAPTVGVIAGIVSVPLNVPETPPVEL